MRYRSLLITLLTLMMVAALATAALAAKPESPPGRTTTTTPTAVTTTTLPGYWTCLARVGVDNDGAVWPLGEYDETAGVYTGQGPALCVDILAAHRDITSWNVRWDGTTPKETTKGLKLVFEEEVHGTVFAETVVYDPAGMWPASLSDVPVGNLVFVAMPHQGDKWTNPPTFTITPLLGG
jgi:hypothetical protein